MSFCKSPYSLSIGSEQQDVSTVYKHSQSCFPVIRFISVHSSRKLTLWTVHVACIWHVRCNPVSALRSEYRKNNLTDVKVNFHSGCLQQGSVYMAMLALFQLIFKVHCRGDANTCSTIHERSSITIGRYFTLFNPCQPPLIIAIVIPLTEPLLFCRP